MCVGERGKRCQRIFPFQFCLQLLTLHLLCMEYVKVFLLCIYHFSAIIKPRCGERTGQCTIQCIVSGYHLSSGHQDTCFTCSSPASVLHGNTKPTLSKRRTLAYQNINKEEQNSQQLQSLPSVMFLKHEVDK